MFFLCGCSKMEKPFLQSIYHNGRYLMERPTCASTVIINTATIERRNSAVRAIPLIFYKNYI